MIKQNQQSLDNIVINPLTRSKLNGLCFDQVFLVQLRFQLEKVNKSNFIQKPLQFPILRSSVSAAFTLPLAG